MRKGWKYKKLGEVATYINGYAFKPDQWKESGTPIVRIQNLNNENAPYNYYDGEVPDKVKIQNGDLLISWSASLGAYIWHGGNAFLNQHIFKVAFDKTDIDKFFLKYAVTSKLAAMAEQVHGATMKHIVKKDFDNTQIPYPPLSTQLAIVSELDKINELIRLKKEQLKDFDNLAQSLFYEMFGDPVENEMGWEVKKLGEIGEFKNGLNFSKDENGHSIKFLGVSDFQNKKSIASDQLAYISLSERVQEDYLLKTDDIVFVRSNGKKELIGRSVKMYITEPTTYSGFCIRCRITDEKVDKDYIAILLKTPIIRQFMTNSGRGCNISNLNQKVLNSIPTILPPLSLQRLFAQRIEQIEREKSEVQKSIQNLETLQASRMQYWFE